VPVLTNTLTPPDLLQYYLADSGASVAVCEAAFVDRFNRAALDGTPLERLIVVNGAPNAGAPVKTVSAAPWPASFPTALEAADTHRDDMAFWMYSSGSTGRPKGIVHLQHDMAYTHAAYGRHLLALTPDDICFSVPKIYFAYGLGNSMTFPFAAGASCVLLPHQPRPAAIFETIARYRPTVFFGLPTLYTALTKAPEAKHADLSSLRLSVSAAEVLPGEVLTAWKALSGLDIMEGLGSTEVLHIYLSNTPGQRKPGAAGKRVPGYEIRLTAADGREAVDGEEGILSVRADSNAPCYWNRPDKTAETMREEGWIWTGDRFVRDADGFHFFRGRADDLVKVSGQWVYPLEVELCLADHPHVRECAVLAVPLADGLTTLKAFVVLAGGALPSEVTTRTLQDYVKGRLLPYKYPRLVDYLDDLPKTGTGKIDRQALLKRET
jgi:acetyl-CoA synthetase